MKKLVVTGGLGFIEVILLEKSLKYKILNIDKITYAGNTKNLTKLSKDKIISL